MMFNFKDIKLIPNIISSFRLLLTIPLCIIFIFIDDISLRNNLLIFLIIIAFLSDISDGYVARKYNQVSEFGKIIDPLADKVLVFLFVLFFWKLNYINNFYFLIIILRDFLILIGGIFVSRKINKVVSSDYIGKGTVFMIGLNFLFILLNFTSNIIYKFFYFLSVILIFISFINYLIKSIKLIKNGNI